MAEAASIKIVIVTPGGEKLSTEADEVVSPAHLGEFGAMPEHIEFFTKNPPGVFTLIKDGKKEIYAVGKGFVEVGPDHIQLLVQSAEKADEIDKDRAEKAKASAEEALSKLDGNLDDPKWKEHSLKLKRAEARLSALEKV